MFDSSWKLALRIPSLRQVNIQAAYPWPAVKMGRICFFPNCDPKHRDFVVFPFRRTAEFENWWRKSGWDKLLSTKKLPEKILICEAHFEERLINRRYKVPRLALGALPSRNVECPARKAAPKPPVNPDSNEVLLHRLFCRLCGEMQETNLDEDGPLLENLDDIFRHLQLADSALLPMGVCQMCREKAAIVQKFWKDCSDAQDNLRVIFNQDNTVELPSNDAIANDGYEHAEHDDTNEIIETITDAEYYEHNYDSRSDIFDILPKEESESEVMEYTITSDQTKVDDQNMGLKTIEHNADSQSADDREVGPKPAGQANESKTDNCVVCEICGKVLRSRAAINVHLKSHSSEREHMCGTCGKKFRQRRQLVEHVQSKHENKIFPCRVCGILYRWQKGLDRHMKVHKGTQLKYPCNVCEKTFPHPHQLKRHMMLHSGDRIYCDVCGKGYRFNYMLTQHKIREHNMHFEGVKLYSKPHLKNKNVRRRNMKKPEPEQQPVKVEFTEEGASEIVEYDSIAIDINPVDGSEISREIYVEQIEEKYNLDQ